MALLSAIAKRIVSALSKKLCVAGLDLGIESDYAGYLGVDLSSQPQGILLLSQTGLILQFLDDSGLTNSASSKPTPVHDESLLLHSVALLLVQSSYNFRSFLRKLMYLSSNTRPDIAFANQQCACFGIYPKEPHRIALKRIDRYLLGTKDKGVIICPSRFFFPRLLRQRRFHRFMDHLQSQRSQIRQVMVWLRHGSCWHSRLLVKTSYKAKPLSQP